MKIPLNPADRKEVGTTNTKGNEALIAKSRCLMGMLLTPEQYRELLQSKSLPEAARYLRDHPAYADTFENVDLDRLHRSGLEYLLEQNLVDVYVRFYTFSHGPERHFFASLLKEFEVYYLLEAVRACLAGAESTRLYRLPAFFAHHSDLNFHKIFSSQTPAALLDALAGTEYYKSCAPILSDTQDFDFLLLESALYKHYYQKLYDTEAEMLDHATAAAFREALAYRADLTNLIKIMRLRRFAGLSRGAHRANIFSYLIPLRLRLTEDHIAGITSAPGDAEALAICDTLFPEFSKLFNIENYQGNITQYYMKRYAKKLSRNPGASLMVVYGFLILKEIEISNIVHTVEAIRYNLPPALGEHPLVL